MGLTAAVHAIFLLLALGACANQNATPTVTPVPEPTPTSVPPTAAPSGPQYWPTGGWRTSTPEEQGIDSEQLAELMDYLLEQQGTDIDSLMIVRNGYVVMDVYFYPFEKGMLHDLASATKSFTSSLIGIAIEQGHIQSVEQPVLDFFPERVVANLSAEKEAMTLEDLLTMRSGIECHGEVTVREMIASPDWGQFILDLPVISKPGLSYNYCSQNSHLLSAVIQEATGMSALSYAGQNLFGPLGIPDVTWPSDPQGNSWGWGDLKATPNDMAKLGYLYLNRGQWDGRQLVSEEWVAAATSGRSYGYQWWLKPSGAYYATGVGGQEIWVVPDKDLIVVMTGATGGGGANAWGDRLMSSRLLPLVESSAALPPNPDGVASLKSKILAAAKPAESQPKAIPPMPEIVSSVAGTTYAMDPNPAGIHSFSVDFPEESVALAKMRFADATHILWRIGLDDVLRFSPGLFGLTSGAKGWWESEDIFVVSREDIGSSRPREERISATFEDDEVTLQIENSDGAITVVGRLEE
jgi:CubicO group peptidase (beta-lactamase class C family)